MGGVIVQRPPELPAARRKTHVEIPPPEPPEVPGWRARATRYARPVLVISMVVIVVVGVVWAVAAGAARDPQTVGAVQPAPPRIDSLPVPTLVSSAPPAAAAADAAAGGGGICDSPALADALAAGDDGLAIFAVGGGEAFRSAVVSGAAPCLTLDDPARVWTVVNKLRPYGQVDYAPSPLAVPDGIRNIPGGALRTDAAEAVQELVAGAAQAGVGEIGIGSAYRSYTTQKSTYAGHVSSKGQEGADAVSARPGFSEHQSGLAVDLSACDGRGCSAIEDFGPTDQGRWVADHAWEYGFIVRYEDGRTAITGYSPEPWHLRYIGKDLARAYHEGGWHTLEEFFGLPAAPDYAD
jgi:zinc D-Ala-D-Ala carboxypeptidase